MAPEPDGTENKGWATITAARTLGSFSEPEKRRLVFERLREQVSTFVSVLRPRVRSFVADLNAGER